MQRIMTREEKAKKLRRNQWLIGIILISIMVFSTLGFAFSGKNNNDNKLNYNGIEFFKDNSGYWYFNIQGYDFATKYNPEETEDISFFNYLTLQDYTNKPLYFVGNYQEPKFELQRNLNPFVTRFNDACLNNQTCNGDYPIKKCSEDNIIIIQEINYDSNEKESILQEDNCIFIIASLTNQTKYADALLFKLLRIN